MKKRLMNKNKILIVLIVSVLLFFILGSLFISILGIDNRNIIRESISNYFNNINNNKLGYSKEFLSIFINNLLLDIFIWIMGISIIGIIIIYLIIIYKSFILGFSISSIIYTYNLKGIGYGFIYIIPLLIELLILFIVSYYAICFSNILFKCIFFKRDYNKNIIIKRYIKLLVISIIGILCSSLLYSFVMPYIIKFIFF